MTTSYKIIIFLTINFLTLYIGSTLSQNGPNLSWYENLNKSPWTPPGWAFGIAWSIIMICFSFYLASLFNKIQNRKEIIILFILQIILNISWNPIFFYFNNIALALINISLLLILISFILIKFKTKLKIISILLAPYIIWLTIATSLNLYIWIYN